MADVDDDAQLMDPKVLGRIGHLELLSLRVVDGFLSGKHRSTQRGGCFEFAEHRAYTAGDEIRLIDWRVYGKSDRYYIKQFEEETNLQALMVVDASGSMQFGLSTASKISYARVAAACLSRLMLRQRDAVGLALFDQAVRQYIPPRAYPAHLQAILSALRQVEVNGETSLAAALHEVGKRLKRRGMVVIFSDCFGDSAALGRALHHLRIRGHEVMLFHVLAPEEVHFTFNRWSRFECLEEDGYRLDLDPVAIRTSYLERMNKFLADLERDCTRVGCDYIRLETNQPLEDTLSLYLNRRAARQKAR